MMRMVLRYHSGLREEVNDAYTILHHLLFYDVLEIELEHNGEIKKVFSLKIK